jgi:hypothetical protein
LAALAAFALGGSALASAAHKSTRPTPPAAQTQTQTQANQVAPDGSAEVADNPAEAQSGAADTDNVQQGDQTGSEPAGSQSEQASSESGPSDGPGGYADTSPGADTQQQGEN